MKAVYVCEDRANHRSEWVVITRHARHSAFDGYRRMPSAYSTVCCRRCGRVWRTNARYVGTLPDGQFDRRDQ